MIGSPSTIVGREREIEVLRSALAEALDGRARAVLISGEPGIGKSTLMAALAGEAVAKGARVSFVRAPEAAGAPPYWLWTETLREDAALTPPTTAQTSRASTPPVLARILPDLAARFGEPSAPAPDVGEAERFRLADAIASLLLSSAREGGRVVVLDDLHAADASSLEVIAHVASRLASGRLLILGAHRDAPDDVNPALRSMLARVSRYEGTLRIPLTGLDAVAVQRQLATILGGDVEAELAGRVHARTGGNPFFTAEIGRLIVQQGSGAAALPPGVPPSVRDVITWRVSRLPGESREVLDRAALIGREAPIDVLSAACGSRPAAVLAALEPAVSAGMIRPDASTARIGFVHPLVAEAIAESLPLARAAIIHEEVATAIETARAGALDDWLPALARHWAAAVAGERSAQRTLEVAGLAARQAERRLAFADALPLWRMAVDAADRAGAGAVTRAELRLGLARALFRTGDVGSALDACLAAAADAETGGRPDLGAAAALVVEGVSEPQWAAMLIGLAEGALRRLPADDLALRARLHARIGQLLHLTAPDPEREQADAARAVQLAEASGDGQALQDALRARQFVASGPEGAEERLDNAASMIRIAQDSGDAWPELWGHLWAVDALVQLGRLAEAEVHLDRLAPVVDILRWPVARWHLLRSRATILQARGRFDEALDSADGALGALSGSGLERATLTHTAFLEGHAEAVGEVPGGDDRRRRLREAAAKEPGVVLWLARSLLREGAVQEARAVYARLPPPDRWNPPRYVLSIALRLRLESALDLALRDEVENLAARLRAVAHRHVAAGSATFITFGSGFLSTGRAAAVMGDLDRAVVELDTAVADDTRCGVVTMAIAARQELAEVLVRRRAGTDLDRARDLASGVLEEARRLAMRPYVKRASELLDGLPRRRLRSEKLSARELEVARLVAQGLTNRQLALRLGISERTAENHLDHIFSKLAVGSRAQVAAWVAGCGGSAPPR